MPARTTGAVLRYSTQLFSQVSVHLAANLTSSADLGLRCAPATLETVAISRLQNSVLMTDDPVRNLAAGLEAQQSGEESDLGSMSGHELRDEHGVLNAEECLAHTGEAFRELHEQVHRPELTLIIDDHTAYTATQSFVSDRNPLQYLGKCVRAGWHML